MKKAFLGFMTLLILTPVLVCTMAFCPMQAAQAAGQESCHQSDDSSTFMLSVDCMGVDLFQTDARNDIQPDLSLDKVDHVWVNLIADYSFKPDDVNSIRGPPDKQIDPQSGPSLILTTQRLRI